MYLRTNIHAYTYISIFTCTHVICAFMNALYLCPLISSTIYSYRNFFRSHQIKGDLGLLLLPSIATFGWVSLSILCRHNSSKVQRHCSKYFSHVASFLPTSYVVASCLSIYSCSSVLPRLLLFFFPILFHLLSLIFPPLLMSFI